ncbi:Acetylornithine deacetylase/Succinyl-diaminopimelate desuccinylase [Jatrophihabitans endophyticus]|uniref:Acetylornithine deacetylase/Succinyl-diaminopimelate desuccinylase n=1 Tax=Jatrophihabitans endophyticus TaxID=1206085 RepID=A0A1M5P4S3_9ACTN|nr:M20/M25/M40 family metallo-hydrolase [Jatrophihabitans endophyticus]SHG96735.1 Acetylornithine deacetylase/Succinyl-diaminopimelate desuccinylase [Jatrophihabitans endophyticus]
MSPATGTLEQDAVRDCADLVRFDTSNFGGGDSRGEREAAEWVAEQLTDCGYRPEVYESAPRRASTVVRIPGRDRSAPGLVVHGHLDVVPAEASDWSFDPFCGEIRDGVLLGRGTLDMKNMDAMMLAVARDLARTGSQPARDVVLAFVADEEDTGAYGAGYLVREHPDLFEGVTTGIGESGGGLTVLPDGSRLYAVGTGERGTAWMTLRARGTAGHGSRPNADNAVTTLARTVTALADVDWPVRLIPTVRAFLAGVGARLGIDIDPADPDSLRRLGDAYPLVERTLANSLNPTMLGAGYKVNVIPTEAVAHVDGRILPGLTDEFFAAVDAVLPAGVTREFDSYTAPVGASHESAAFAAMAAAITEHDPQALVLPFVLGGGTDAKSFTRLGIDCYGFMPGRTPSDFPAERYVHGVDEQIPVDSLEFGVRVLSTFLLAEEIR